MPTAFAVFILIPFLILSGGVITAAYVHSERPRYSTTLRYKVYGEMVAVMGMAILFASPFLLLAYNFDFYR